MVFSWLFIIVATPDVIMRWHFNLFVILFVIMNIKAALKYLLHYTIVINTKNQTALAGFG